MERFTSIYAAPKVQKSEPTETKRQGFHYSNRTLKAANHKFSSRESALEATYQYFATEFAGLEIPHKYIRTAFDRCFQGACNQEMLNRDVKNYLLKNLASM